MKSGQPVGVSMTHDTANVGEGGKIPNRIRDANNGPKTIDERFDTGASEFPEEFQFGNVGVTLSLDLGSVSSTLRSSRTATSKKA